MNRIYKWILFTAAAACILSSCDGGSGQIVKPGSAFTENAQPIINGTRVSSGEHLETVALVMKIGGQYSAFCSGTLISPEYVLTAGHCISQCLDDSDNIELLRPDMRVGIGSSEHGLRKVYEIAEFVPHPDFYCSDVKIKNDIALIKLRRKVPHDVAVPIPPLPPELALTAGEVDKQPVSVLHVGFGKTNPENEHSSGVKYKVEDYVVAACPLSGRKSSMCSRGLDSGFMYTHYNVNHVSTCQGDSGGPTFVNRDGRAYVCGVTSWGEEGCMGYSAMTNVTDYYDSFIKKTAGYLGSEEDCFNKIDDNYDGKVDCDDPQCAVKCQPEDCTNGVDDNDNGMIDCDDPQCKNAKKCQPENCTNGVDDNENGKTDCDDPQCSRMIRCQREVCTNGYDDNADGLTDCADPQCQSEAVCRPEDCTNGIDDNGNGMIDCNDPECFVKPICRPEDCSNGIDDNGDGLIDCQDVKCIGTGACQPEDCSNGIDDNGNGMADCADPDCSLLSSCRPEICDNAADDNGNGLIDCADPACKNHRKCLAENCVNGIDDNDNGLIDCADPGCALHKACAVEICDDGIDNDGNGDEDCMDAACADSAACAESNSGCASTPLNTNSPVSAALLALIAGFGFAVTRRRPANR